MLLFWFSKFLQNSDSFRVTDSFQNERQITRCHYICKYTLQKDILVDLIFIKICGENIDLLTKYRNNLLNFKSSNENILPFSMNEVAFLCKLIK